MPSIAQQDYIIINWDGKDSGDAAKKADVDAQLKNIFLANPLALFSVIFKGYGDESGETYLSFSGFYKAGTEVIALMVETTPEIIEYSFDVE